jgi:hypothetical protein
MAYIVKYCGALIVWMGLIWFVPEIIQGLNPGITVTVH